MRHHPSHPIRGFHRPAGAALASLAVIAALVGAADARAGVTAPIAPPPPQEALLTGPPDLVVTGTGWSTIRISNVGRQAAGAFSVSISRGRIGECNLLVPAVTRTVAGIGARQSATISVPQSSTDRTVTVDYLNTVAEGNETNNTSIMPGMPVPC
jgi:hypothetical protein